MKLNKSLCVIYLLLFVCILSSGVLLNGCKPKPVNTIYQLTGDVIKDGQALVQSKCTTCHKLVPDDALSKGVWLNHTLPAMAKYLHIATYGGTQYFKNDPLDTAGITLQNWQAIVAYYTKVAPDSLPKAKPPVPLINDWAGFTLKKPLEAPVSAYTTMVSYRPDTHTIYSADGYTNRLYEWNKELKPHTVTETPSPIVDAKFVKNDNGSYRGVFSCIGVLLPRDFPNGRVIGLDVNDVGTKPVQTVIASELTRPVETVPADFNKDGLTDFLICGQGGLKGGIYLMTQKPDHTYIQSNITDKPGAVQAITGDFNNDGWQDVMILYGTADEGIWMYTNDHKGGFTSKNIIRFPPVYGSASFQLVDINHDGKLDLIYTSGYNYHDSRILKPYNGLYIFTNQGDWNFKQSYFYPINGCTKAIAADFDGDGDLDIATTAFFADLKNNPAEGCIYFEQDGPMNFKPHAIPVSQYGRWMCMDADDVNGDGKPDLILGNFSENLMIQNDLKPFWNKRLPFIVLENHMKK